MRIITSFPERFRLVNEQVSTLYLYYPLLLEDLDPEDLPLYASRITSDSRLVLGYYDFFVELKGERCLAFSAYTPEYLRRYLDDESKLSFVTSGLVVVSEVSVEAILDALEHCLDEAQEYGLEHFGYLHPCLPRYDDNG